MTSGVSSIKHNSAGHAIQYSKARTQNIQPLRLHNATFRSLSERTHNSHFCRGAMFASFLRCLLPPTGAEGGSSGATKDSYPEDDDGEGGRRGACFLRCFADVLEEQEGVTALPRRSQRNSDGGCSRVVVSKRRARIASYSSAGIENTTFKNRYGDSV